MARQQYRGFKFPVQKGSDGIPAAAVDEELIRTSILQILTTTPGERLMRPLFGCNLHKYVFANNNEVTADLLQAEVRAAISRWEPRVLVTDVTVVQEDTTLTLTVDYVVRSVQRADRVEYETTVPSSV